ncbi:SIF3 [Sanghuangporus vaninii]
MSRSTVTRKRSGSILLARAGRSSLSTIQENSSRRASGSAGTSGAAGIANANDGGAKTQRSSKTSTKLVVLPSEPQTKPLPGELEDETSATLITQKGASDVKSEGERMSKTERNRAGYKRLTAYCIAESFRMKLLAAFLKREHNVSPRVFDEALYVMYHLPLLPGYDSNINVRSSSPPKIPGGKSFLSALSEAEEDGYQGTYFAPETGNDGLDSEGFIPSSSPDDQHNAPQADNMAERPRSVGKAFSFDKVAEVIFFTYGVVVFYGLEENQEREIIEDIDHAGVLVRKIGEADWEIEECHYAYDPYAAYPRIYNDLFTFKSHSHLLKISIAHALAQSTLLARYESKAALVLSDPRTVAIPRTLATTGELRLHRRDALKLTGRLFQLRRDVNLVSNVLDVPELFWSEASLRNLYDAVREYMEISQRVTVLNEKLAVASDLLDLIHSHLNGNAMERITWIIIWLIVVACLVEMGEVVARLIVHATMSGKDPSPPSDAVVTHLPLSREQAFTVLENLMRKSG